MNSGKPGFTRRLFLKSLAGVGMTIALRPNAVSALTQTAITKPIPSTGEQLPVIGMGTSRTFDVGNDPVARDTRMQVLQAFFDNNGEIIDSSPMYGSSEKVIGYCLGKTGNRNSLFSATKVWVIGKEFGISQMQNSEALWGVPRFDLIQIHNMLNWETHMETLKSWKEEGRVRYIGITTSHGRRHEKLEKALTREAFDFVQFSYNILDRDVEQRLLPLAAERNIAVIINRPFRTGELFRYSDGQPLPKWAHEFDCKNWAQFLLKFIVSHPSVTCTIPATTRVDHMLENMGAGFGQLPDAATRMQMIRYFENMTKKKTQVLEEESIPAPRVPT
jgi:diketogulonate reductase-like aldo/keto reductase